LVWVLGFAVLSARFAPLRSSSVVIVVFVVVVDVLLLLLLLRALAVP